jgi:hypothetical protein
MAETEVREEGHATARGNDDRGVEPAKRAAVEVQLRRARGDVRRTQLRRGEAGGTGEQPLQCAARASDQYPFSPAAVLADIARRENSLTTDEDAASPDATTEGRVSPEDGIPLKATCIGPDCLNPARLGEFCDKCQSHWQDEQRAKAAAAAVRGSPLRPQQAKGFLNFSRRVRRCRMRRDAGSFSRGQLSDVLSRHRCAESLRSPPSDTSGFVPEWVFRW